MGRKGMIIALLLTALAVCLCTAAAAEVSGDYQYRVKEDGNAVITAYYKYSSFSDKGNRFAIPAVIDGYTVTEIGDGAFSGSLETYAPRDTGCLLIIPDTVVRIGDRAFSSCEAITEVILPDSVVSIGELAFVYCKLGEVTIPGSVTHIGDGAFMDNPITNVTIPNSVIELSGNPFAGCRQLTEITVSPDHPSLTVVDGMLFSEADRRLICFPAGLKATACTIPDGTRIIGSQAFCSCRELLEITIPDSVTVIGDLAFRGCRGLTAVTIPDSVTAMGINPFRECRTIITVSIDQPYLAVIDGVLFSKPDRRLICYPANLEADSYIIPQGIRIIGDYAFYYSRLTSVTIPDSVTAIGNSAFVHSALTTVTLPNGIADIGDCAFEGCANLAALTLPDRPIRIGRYAFNNCMGLSAVTVAESGTARESEIATDLPGSIGEYAFSNCQSLTEVTIPNGISVIGDSAFASCDNLTAVTIPDSVTAIGNGAFYACRNLATLTLPDSVAEIGSNVVSPWTALVISIDHPYLALVDDVLYSKQDRRLVLSFRTTSPDEMTDFSIPEGIRIIRDNAGLVGYAGTIPDSVVSIGDCAMQACRTTDLVIPDSVAEIGRNAFWRSTMTTLTLPNTAIDIGSRAFMDCGELVTVSVADGGEETAPEGKGFLRAEAFANCTGLTGVTLPDTVVAIGEGAFLNCAALTEVTLPASLSFIGNHAFHVYDKNTDTYEPIASVTFTVPRNSYARQYCIDNGFPFTYPDLLDWLKD